MAHVIRTHDRMRFKDCRLAWDWGSKIRQNLEPANTAQALRFGTAVHGGLETWYKPETWHLDTDLKATLAISAFVALYPQTEFEDDWEANRDLGIAMLRHYFETFINDGWEPVAVELEFEVPVQVPYMTNELINAGFEMRLGTDSLHGHDLYLHGEPVVYQGRIDLIIRDAAGKLWLVDHKTAAKMDSNLGYLDRDEQCGSYAWAIQNMLGIKLEGVIYNQLIKAIPKPPRVLKDKSLSKDKAQSTTYELYLDAIETGGYNLAEYADVLDHFREQGNKFFLRTQVHRSQRELMLLGERIGLEAIDMLNTPSIYPNPSKFKCNYCDFKVPCLQFMEGSDYEWSLRELFSERD